MKSDKCCNIYKYTQMITTYRDEIFYQFFILINLYSRKIMLIRIESKLGTIEIDQLRSHKLCLIK